MSPQPPLTPPGSLAPQLSSAGWAVLNAEGLGQLCGVESARLQAWQPLWHDLPPDPHLRDGGHYRQRRHSCFVVRGAAVEQAPHRAHWQPVDYNALHGGFERWFEPMPAAWVVQPAWQQLLVGLAGVASRMRGVAAGSPWFVEAHPFRITTEGGIGRPTPEGAHRDGVDLVVVLMVQRHNVKGGETRVFDSLGPQGVRFTLQQPWSALLLDDERVIHESTPIQNQQPGSAAWRDTLVLTFRQHGFQGP
jgi:hypothetical protein